MRQKRKRVLFVLNRGWTRPSNHVRALQYRELFDADSKWDAEFIDLCSARFENLISRAQALCFPLVWKLLSKILWKFYSYWSRYRQKEILKKASNCDLVYFLKLNDLNLLKNIKSIKKVRLCMDFVDGLWLPLHRNSFGGEALKLEELLGIVDAVICENNYTASYAKNYCKSLYIVPDAPPLDKFNESRKTIVPKSKKVVVGWVGSPETARPLICLLDDLDKLAAEGLDFELRVLGCPAALFSNLEFLPCHVIHYYNEMQMIEELLKFDIGLFPLSCNQDALTRGVGKALVYMSAGVVVVAQKRGEVVDLIDHGQNGFLAETNADWMDKVKDLVGNSNLRNSLSKKGYETIKTRFDKKLVFQQLCNSFDKIVAEK
jgi:glycosyltransferase involved in cell wall biosynthesis